MLNFLLLYLLKRFTAYKRKVIKIIQYKGKKKYKAYNSTNTVNIFIVF